MRELIESLPGHAPPDVEREADRTPALLSPPDDDDFIRPAAEEELLEERGAGGLTSGRGSSLAKHLLWTFGPDHRALPFPLQLRTELEGDRVVNCDVEIGWLHQGLEKALEEATFEDALAVIERLQPQNALGHQLAWLLLLERMCGIDHLVPRRAQLWRVVMCELSRMLEHLRVLRGLVMLHAGRPAQRSLTRAEAALEALLPSVSFDDTGVLRACVGGLREPLPVSVAETLRREVPAMLAPLWKVTELQLRLPSSLDALQGLGALDGRLAGALGFSGPALKACGADEDIRRSAPYFAYDELSLRVPVENAGDARARFRVRLEELSVSAELIESALRLLDDAAPEVRVEASAIPRNEEGQLRPPAGMATASVELAGGEFSLLVVSDGGPRPRRARLRTPSFPLAAALGRLLKGARLDEVEQIITSLGLIGPEIDR
ncbi:MAG: hypothetical protein ACO3JL_03375 [Myxococcota bacterium]